MITHEKSFHWLAGLCAAMLFTAGACHAGWVRIDDFQDGPLGKVCGSSGWATEKRDTLTLAEVATDPLEAGNRALRISRALTGPGKGYEQVAHNGLVNIPSGRTGTVFLRFRLNGDSAGGGHNIRLGVGPGDVRAGVRIQGKEPAAICGLGEGGAARPLKPGVWYRLWLVVQNRAGQSARGQALIQEEGTASRQSLGKAMGSLAVDLNAFSSLALLKHTPDAFWLDDVYADNGGENLGCPLDKENRPAPFEPRTIVLAQPLKADGGLVLKPEAEPVDALGPTGWFQGLWPTDASMPNPKFPRFAVEPEQREKSGFSIAKQFPMDRHLDSYLPKLSLDLLGADGKEVPLYSGGADAQIAYRFGNLLKLIDTSGSVSRSVELAIVSHQSVLVRVRAGGSGAYTLRGRVEVKAGVASEAAAGRAIFPSPRGWYGVELMAGKRAGEALALAAYDAADREQAELALREAGKTAADFDGVWQKLARPQSLAPFLLGTETSLERNLVAACVNRVLRNQRQGGLIRQPSGLEFFGPEWYNGAAVWMWFQPACRYNLWIEPSFLAHTLGTILDRQGEDGFVPQVSAPDHSSGGKTQNPNISVVAFDYYRFTGDRDFLVKAYPKLKKMYQWFLKHRNPDGTNLFAIGDGQKPVQANIYEYGRDNNLQIHGVIPSMRDVPGVDNRQERLFLPDIIACQARLAEDLAFMARELGCHEDENYFSSEYRRVKEWANQNLWDEKTTFYYPVVRATGQKVMRRLNTAFWLLWAGIPDARQKDELIKALFDPKQFFTTIPLPQLALNDPAFNPKIGHWGDGYVWPIDAFHTFDGLLRYGEWSKAADFAGQFNRGIFMTIKSTYQPNEYYYHTGRAVGEPTIGSAGCLPLVFQRYLKDYQAGRAQADWAKFVPVRR